MEQLLQNGECGAALRPCPLAVAHAVGQRHHKLAVAQLSGAEAVAGEQITALGRSGDAGFHLIFLGGAEGNGAGAVPFIRRDLLFYGDILTENVR
ncbi:hypothetical protein D3C75_1028630 [compost metagenome]